MNIVFIVGAFDAILIAGMGLLAAALFLLGKEDWSFFSQRLFPAVGVLVGTSFAAGIVMAISQWLGS